MVEGVDCKDWFWVFADFEGVGSMIFGGFGRGRPWKFGRGRERRVRKGRAGRQAGR